MILKVLDIVYSVPFMWGMAVGVIIMRLVQELQCRHLDRVDPLPNDQHHRPPPASGYSIGIILIIAVVGYVLLQTARTEQHYVQLADDVVWCQVEFNDALRARADVSAQNDALSIEQRDLLSDLDAAGGQWIDTILRPPESIAVLPQGDERRLSWERGVTLAYHERADALRARIAEIRAQQTELARQRELHPLPEPRCGVSPAP